ncbi:hypothetical protein ACQWHW_25125, partial [Salmonella enterica subsp. enterica serovar Infantis]
GNQNVKPEKNPQQKIPPGKIYQDFSQEKILPNGKVDNEKKQNIRNPHHKSLPNIDRNKPIKQGIPKSRNLTKPAKNEKP